VACDRVAGPTPGRGEDLLIGELDSPPIIMGHSFGGAFTQILLDRGLGAAGVAIDSAPVKGLLALPASTLKSGFPVLKNPANNHARLLRGWSGDRVSRPSP
jgi:pimeloyl-ACP methyl ester carboxylesterase